MTRKETSTSKELTAFRPFNTIRFLNSKAEAVRYAKDMLDNLANVSPLTITIEQDKSEGYFVSTATAISSEDIQAAISYKRQQITSEVPAQIG